MPHAEGRARKVRLVTMSSIPSDTINKNLRGVRIMCCSLSFVHGQFSVWEQKAAARLSLGTAYVPLGPSPRTTLLCVQSAESILGFQRVKKGTHVAMMATICSFPNPIASI